MIVLVSEKVLCYTEKMVSVSLPINVEKRISELPISSKFKDIIDILDGNQSKLTLSNTRGVYKHFNAFSIISDASINDVTLRRFAISYSWTDSVIRQFNLDIGVFINALALLKKYRYTSLNI